MITNVQGERVVWLPDIHIPYHNGAALGSALEFVKWFKPQHIFIIGDFLDFYQVSRFVRDPKRKMSIQDDLFEGQELLAKITKLTPKAKRIFLQGNHEARLKKFIWTTAEELSGITSLEVPELLQTKKLGWEYIEQGWTHFHGLLVKHGNVVRQNAGYSAFGELTKNGMSGISGHTHRLGQTFIRNQAGLYTWIESGCLCNLNPEYLEGQIANWQHGLTVGFMKTKGEQYSVSPIPIVEGKLLFDLKQFSN